MSHPREKQEISNTKGLTVWRTHGDPTHSIFEKVYLQFWCSRRFCLEPSPAVPRPLPPSSRRRNNTLRNSGRCHEDAREGGEGKKSRCVRRDLRRRRFATIALWRSGTGQSRGGSIRCRG